MSWNTRIRRIHRWLSVAFALAVIVNVAAFTQGQPARAGLLGLPPLVLLLPIGLYLFVVPHAAAWRDARPHPLVSSTPPISRNKVLIGGLSAMYSP